MRRTERSTGTNRDFGHHTAKPSRGGQPSDRQLLREARRATEQWQDRLTRQRRAEASR